MLSFWDTTEGYEMTGPEYPPDKTHVKGCLETEGNYK